MIFHWQKPYLAVAEYTTCSLTVSPSFVGLVEIGRRFEPKYMLIDSYGTELLRVSTTRLVFLLGAKNFGTRELILTGLARLNV